MAVAIVVVVVAALTARLFIWPTVNEPRRADAILVMAGAGPRDQRGLALARQGYAPLLLVSNGLVHNPGVCGSTYYKAKVICFLARPYTTQGEARFLALMAKQYKIHTVIVVSGRAQTVRARLRVQRCFNGRILMDPVSPTSFKGGAYLVAYEWAALLKAELWQRGC